MPEIIDICDSEGHLTGQQLARSEAHRQEQWHRVALVWVINTSGQLLVQRRAEHLGCFPGLWDVSVDGHVSAGDEPTPTAVRELVEELGITAAPSELTFADGFADRYAMAYDKTHQEYDYVFTLRRDIEVKDLVFQAAEVLDARWMTADELERGLRDTPALFAGRSQRAYDIGLQAARQQAGPTP